ncbi:SGNH/GDSL hydrolase family protein [Nitrobacteraceae bacterium UC4446_H13]
MSKLKPLRRLLRERGTLAVLAIAGLMLFAIAAPASAQLFPFFGGGPQQPQRHQPRGGGGGFFSNPFFSPFEQRPPPQQQRPAAERQDFSRAPAPEKREVQPDRYVLVLGDAMADWLGYGLEDALSETPELGVVRKHKTVSGLIRYQPKGEPSDWAAAAKEILATEKPEVIVMMLGLHDRMPIREPAADKKTDAKTENKPDGKTDGKPAEAKPSDADDDDPDLQIAAPEKGARGAHGVHQFRDERWGELYSKKIDETIAVLKSKGVPVLWVGLPSIRGTKSTSDALYLNTLYRDAAGRAGITYVDLWDGFVDESGRYLAQGPDFEGQIRRLRSSDGVYFTKAGARKLAHYVEREISRVLAGRPTTIEIPTEPGTPEAEAKPGLPAPRPIAGPVIPLVASSVGTDELLGAANVRPASVDPLVAKTLVKGDALTPPPGRADDAAWPRREVERERAGEPVVAAVTPSNGTAAGATRPGDKPKRQHIIVRTNDQRFGDASPQQRRSAPPRPLPPPPGPADWLSRLFR